MDYLLPPKVIQSSHNIPSYHLARVAPILEESEGYSASMTPAGDTPYNNFGGVPQRKSSFGSSAALTLVDIDGQ